MAIQVYGLTLAANGVSSAAYYEVNLATGGEFIQGGATIYPSAVGATSVNLYGVALEIEAPASAMVAGGATLTTNTNIVAGRMAVSPAINVDIALTLFGTTQIGTATLKAGQTVSNFSFTVSDHPGIPDATAKAFLDRVLPKKS